MKKPILILSALLITITMSAQWAVTDPGNTAVNNANLVKSGSLLVKAGKSLSEAKKNVELLKDAKKTIEKVSNVFNNVQDVKDIIKQQSEILDYVNDTSRMLSRTDVFTVDEMNDMAGAYNTLISRSVQQLDKSQDIITDDLFKMDDAQRLTTLTDINEKLKEILSEARIITRRYSSIANKRIIKKHKNG